MGPERVKAGPAFNYFMKSNKYFDKTEIRIKIRKIMHEARIDKKETHQNLICIA